MKLLRPAMLRIWLRGIGLRPKKSLVKPVVSASLLADLVVSVGVVVFENDSSTKLPPPFVLKIPENAISSKQVESKEFLTS
ncbi:hypothetical protein V6N12_008943 [Hibiscus sabdariffa]|uniref:Uncharacterized protein n=1 Tax=Hibiscus sabdariffa TaxID=183260 RepID=A0ABR2C4E9_9ROSI